MSEPSTELPKDYRITLAYDGECWFGAVESSDEQRLLGTSGSCAMPRDALLVIAERVFDHHDRIETVWNVRRNQGIPEPPWPYQPHVDPLERRHFCPVCSRTYTYEGARPPAPFVCRQCERLINLADDRTRHPNPDPRSPLIGRKFKDPASGLLCRVIGVLATHVNLEYADERVLWQPLGYSTIHALDTATVLKRIEAYEETDLDPFQLPPRTEVIVIKV